MAVIVPAVESRVPGTVHPGSNLQQIFTGHVSTQRQTSPVIVMITVRVVYRLRRRSMDECGCRGRIERLDYRRRRVWLRLTVMALWMSDLLSVVTRICTGRRMVSVP